MTRMLLWLIVGQLWILGASAGEPQMHQRGPGKKLIATGWDQPDTQRLMENLSEMEQRPFDGVVVNVVGRKEGGRACAVRAAFSPEPWKRDWFDSPLAQLRACPFGRFTDNFVLLGANPGNVDWFDDEGWQQITDHWTIAAWIAREGRLRGILFDPEPYTEPFSQFSYSAQVRRDSHSFRDYYAQARLRGRQVMQAVASQYPDITVFCYFLNSIVAHAARHAEPSRALAVSGYGLLPAFVDGWLDVVPPTVRLVDGCESAYRYNSETDFLEAALAIKTACQALVSPENRYKYRAQVQVSFGIYLDAYWNPPTSPWYIDPQGQSRVDRLRANACTAVRVADEYVWVYGERFRWWPTVNTSVQPQFWTEAIPGCEQALRFARDPLDYGRFRLAELTQAGRLANLARNGDFASETVAGETWQAGRPPAGWRTWQDRKATGSFVWDRETGAAGKGSAMAAGLSHGCFMQSFEVKPGQIYAARVQSRQVGRGEVCLRLRWQNADGKWTEEARDVMAFASRPSDQWAEIFTVAQVPASAASLVILLLVDGQSSPEDRAWFDDVELYRLD